MRKGNVLPDCVWSEVLCDLWIVGANHFSEGLDDILLSDFQYNGRARCKVLNKRYILWKNILVDIVELLDGSLCEIEHFHC